MDYSDFLQCYQTLNEIETNKEWTGRLYLPPCSCFTSTKCPHSTSSTAYDFANFSDIDVPKLLNLCKYIDPVCESYFVKSILYLHFKNLSNNMFLYVIELHLLKTHLTIHHKESYFKMI